MIWVVATRERIGPGWEALDSGDWATAKAAFESADDDSPEVLDGLGRALWWLKDVRGAIEIRTRAFAAYRREDRDIEAAAVAVWLARELRTLFRNDAAADGWLARAGTLSSGATEGSVAGWVMLARAEATPDVEAALPLCEEAVQVARSRGRRSRDRRFGATRASPDSDGRGRGRDLGSR